MADTNPEVAHLTQPFVEEIDFNEIKPLEEVGKGSFGTVYKALWRNNFVAVKYIEKDFERNAFTLEVRQLAKVAHKNIVALYGACTKKPRIFLVMEYAEGGSLYNVLHSKYRPNYTAAHAMSWAKQCAEGVAYLHAMKPKPLIHRDLKPPNLLLVDGGRILKICDFGTVTDKSTQMTNNKGSAPWMAPEVFEGSTYTEKCDVFSWGIILWEILSREQPYKNIEYTLRILWSVHTGHRPPLIDGCPKPIEKLITTCWDPNPSSRPSMEEVVNRMTILCSFFRGADEPLNYSDIEYEDAFEYSDTIDTAYTTEHSYPTNSSQMISDLITNSSSSSPSSTSNTLNNTNTNAIVNPIATPMINRNLLNYTNANSMRIEQRLPQQQTNSIRWPNPMAAKNPMQYTLNSAANCSSVAAASAAAAAVAATAASNQSMATIDKPLGMLSIECDPNAWDLKMDNLDFQQIVGNISNNQGNERLTVTDTKSSSASSAATTTPTVPTTAVQQIDGSDASSLDIDAMHQWLDPHLRPVPPDPASQYSQQIFEQHKDLAKEYLQVQSQRAYATKHKEKLLAALDPEQRRERLDLAKKLEEREALLQLEASLKRQLQLIRSGAARSQSMATSAVTRQAPPPPTAAAAPATTTITENESSNVQ